MKIKHILFDLDGTLLPMDQNAFLNGYFRLIAKKLEPFGYKKEEVINGILKGTKVMILNDGSQTNYDAFWKAYASLFGNKVYEEIPVLNEFYTNEFNEASKFCGKNPEAAKTVKALKEMGYGLILATNPLFPENACGTRLNWIDLDVSDFLGFTSYETSHFSKPSLGYYKEVVERFGLNPAECLMVGNDATDDTVPEQLGMQVFLLTDCLINNENKDISGYPQGTFRDLLAYVEAQEKA